MRIAIAGSFGYMDIGDEAMLAEDLRFLKQDLKIPDKNIFLFGINTTYISEHHSHPVECCLSSRQLERNWRLFGKGARRLHSLKSLAKKVLGRQSNISFNAHMHELVRSCSAALITGGGTINTRDRSGYSIKRIHSLVSYFRCCGVPVFMSGQTIGPLGIDARHDALAKEIISSVDYLTVRDSKYSREYLKRIGCVPKRFKETYDDACTLEYRDEVLPEDIKRFVSGSRTVALNTTEYTGNSAAHKKFLATLCTRLIDEDGVQVVLVSHTPKDYTNHLAIYELVSGWHREKMLVPDTRHWSGARIKKLISKCSVAVGGRYHFIVFAGTSNTPFVGMCGNEYSYIKQDGFARSVGLERLILDTGQTWDSSHLWATYQEAKTLKLEISEKFYHPSESMRTFREWLQTYVEK